LAEASKRKLLLKQLGEQLQKRATPVVSSDTTDSAAGSAGGSGVTSLSKRWCLPDDFLTATKPTATAATTSSTPGTTASSSAPGSNKRKAPDGDDEQGSRETGQRSGEDLDITIDLSG